MKCFYHPAADAVGTCKNCHRGICRDCAAERNEGIACANRCEAAVDAVSTLIRRNVQLANEPSWPVALRMIVYWGLTAGMIYFAATREDTTVRLMAGGIAAITFMAGLNTARWLMKISARSPRP